ncbi:MAG: DNA-3-methyladenine glycosylase [Oscillospiraceae bacterium]
MTLGREFFERDALVVAPELIGKLLVRTLPDGTERRLRILETEVYRGTEDTACHAHKGRTKRSEMLYMSGGTIYVYLCYGMHWLMNIVTGAQDEPQGVLIRSCEGADGPGKLTRALCISGEQNGMNISSCQDLRVEDDGEEVNITLDSRVGIKYAEQADIDRLWRFKRG